MRSLFRSFRSPALFLLILVGCGVPLAAEDVRNGLVLRVVYPDDPTEIVSEERANEVCQQVSDFFAENTFNQLRMNWTITQPLMMPRSWEYYNELPSIIGGNPPRLATITTAVRGAARKAAAEAGYDVSDYDFDVTVSRDLNIPSNAAVYMNDNFGANTLAHEVGHNMGAPHAFAWDTQLPNPIGLQEIQSGYSYGVDEVINYGDMFDIMGSGSIPEAHYSVPLKYGNGWLNDSSVWNITESGRYRIHAFDEREVLPGRRYGFQVKKNGRVTYWGGFRDHPELPEDHRVWLDKGIQMWTGAWDSALDTSQSNFSPVQTLLDFTPNSVANNRQDTEDGALVVGKTFSDFQSDIHVTPVAIIDDDPEAMDVVVRMGRFPDNTDPALRLEPSVAPTTSSQQILLPLGGQLRLVARASDAEGDELAYHWDFDDGSNATENKREMIYSWEQPGLYTVRCTVSDMKGGVDSVNVAVNVGLSEFAGLDTADPNKRSVYWGRGRILDQAGEPVQGARVWVVGDGLATQSTTDGDGRFVLANVDLGDNDGVSLQVYKEGFRFIGLNNAEPYPASAIPFNNGDLDRIDFLAYRRQLVSAELVGVNEGDVTYDEEGIPTISEGVGEVIVRLKREGPTPLGKEGDDKFIKDILDTRLLVRLFGLAGNARGISPPRVPGADIPHVLSPTLIFGSDTSTVVSSRSDLGRPTTTYRRLLIQQDDNYDRPFRRNNPIDDSIEFAFGGPVYNPNERIPNGYDPRNPSGESPDPDQRVTYETDQLLRHLYHQNRDDVAAVISPEDQTITNNVVSRDWDNDGDKKGPESDRYVWFHSREEIDQLDATAQLQLQPDYIDIVVPVIDDDRPEEDEYAGFVIGTGLDYWSPDDELVFKIADNDGGLPVLVEISSTGPMWEHQGANYTGFQFERIGSTDQQLRVQLEIPAGTTAEEGVDFEPLPREVTIPAGERFAMLPVKPIDDSEVEVAELVGLRVLPGEGYGIVEGGGRDTAAFFLWDNDVNEVVVNKVADAWENRPGDGAIDGAFRLVRYGNLQQALTVNFRFLHGNDPEAPADLATPNTDFDATQQSVVIPVGSRGVEIPIVPTADSNLEGAEQVVLVIEDGDHYNLRTPNWASMTIYDGQVSTISVERQDRTVAEGDESNFVFSRAGTTDPLIAYYTVVGDADHGVDYRLEAPFSVGTVVFGRDEMTKNVKIAIFDDQQVEGTENIHLRLLPRSPTASADEQATYHIDPSAFQTTVDIADDDDGLPTVRFLHRTTTVSENMLGDTRTIFLDVAISRDPQDINRYDTDLPDPDANCILVDWEVVVDDRTSADHPATAGVDFELHDSGPIGIGLNEDEDDLEVIQGGTLYFRRGKDTTRFASPPSADRNGVIRFTLNADDVPEEDETILVRLKNPRNCKVQEVQVEGELDPGTHIVRVLDDDRGVFTLSGRGEISEAQGDSVTFTVDRGGNVDHPVDVTLNLSGDPVSGRDYRLLVDDEPGEWEFVGDGSEDARYTLHFEPGEELKTLTFVALDDEVREGLEIIAADLTRASRAQVGSPASASITILDDDSIDLPIVTLAFADEEDQSVIEGDGAQAATLLVRRSTGEGALSVGIPVGENSTAVSGEDYSAVPSGVTFAEGQTEASIQVAALADDLQEGTERIEFGILPDGTYEIGEMGGAFVYILDAQTEVPEVGIEVKRDSMNEIDGDRPIICTLIRAGVVRKSLTIDWTVGGSAELGADYRIEDFDGNVYSDRDQITMPAGEDRWRLMLVPVDDTSLEGEESISIELVPATGRYGVDEERAAIAATLIDDDLATVRIVAVEASDAPEGGRVSFEVGRTGGDLGSALSVNIGMSGDALAGSDYSAPTSSLTIPAGAETASLAIATIDDAVEEGDESLVATVTSGASYDIAKGSAEGVIRDNDRTRVWIDEDDAAAVAQMQEEGPVDGVVRLKRSDSSGELTVRFRPGGSARAGSDYEDPRVTGANYGEITFPEGVTEVSLVLETIDDEAIEDEEALTIDLLDSPAGAYNVGEVDAAANASTTLTVISEDVTKVTVVAVSDYTKFGLANPTGFEITRTGKTSAPLRVFYKMTGTASNGVDYELLSTSVDLEEGQTSVVVPIVPVRDPADSLTISMTVDDPTRPGTYQPGNPSLATMTLLSFQDVAVQVVAVDDRAIESGGGIDGSRAVLQTELAGGSSSLSIAYSLEGNATAETDYRLTPDLASTPTMSLDPGVPQEITLEAVRDGLIEMPETVSVSIPVSQATPPDYYVIGRPAQVTIVDVPEMSIELQVIDVLGNPRPTDDYSSDVTPADGTLEIESDRYLFEGLRSTTAYDVLFNPVIFGMRLWMDPRGVGGH